MKFSSTSIDANLDACHRRYWIGEIEREVGQIFARNLSIHRFYVTFLSQQIWLGQVKLPHSM